MPTQAPGLSESLLGETSAVLKPRVSFQRPWNVLVSVLLVPPLRLELVYLPILPRGPCVWPQRHGKGGGVGGFPAPAALCILCTV